MCRYHNPYILRQPALTHAIHGRRQESFWLSVVGRLLETKLLQLLRFKAGDVYSVAVGGFFGAEAPSREGASRSAKVRMPC